MQVEKVIRSVKRGLSPFYGIRRGVVIPYKVSSFILVKYSLCTLHFAFCVFHFTFYFCIFMEKMAII